MNTKKLRSRVTAIAVLVVFFLVAPVTGGGGLARVCALQLDKNLVPGDVSLAWTDGTPPFFVQRSTVPCIAWIDLSPIGGTAAFSWVDSGTATDGLDYCYRVLY